MIKINQEKFSNINLNANGLYILSDFDNTITDAESDGSLNVITKSQLLGINYYNRYLEIVNKYKNKVKTTSDIQLKKELWDKHISEYIKLLKDFDLTYETLEKIIKNSNIKIRKNFDTFLEFLYLKKIPLIIVSSGLGNSIEIFLKINNLFYDNIHVISNYVTFNENGKIIDVPQKVITPVTKNEIILNKNIKKAISNRNNKLVFGDIPNDIGMTDINKMHNTISISFCNSESLIEGLCDNFDIVTDNSNIFEVLKELIDGEKNEGILL